MNLDLSNSLPPDGGGLQLDDGRYTLVHQLGRGGNAVVYQAWDARLGVWRAIKVLARKRRHPYGLSRFVSEARIMAGLSHPNLVSVIDLHQHNERPFLVQELVRGGSLYDWIAHNGVALPAVDAVSAVAQICGGLQVAHDAGLIHRDVKPHNILVAPGPTYRLTDFGIARLQDRGPERNGGKLGTVGFMSPEQQLRPGEVDARADVYSLGATLYALLTRRSPPPLAECERDPAMLRGLPELVVPVIRRATHHHPDRRYQSAAELGAALRRVMALLPERPMDAPPMFHLRVPIPTEEDTPTGDTQGVRRRRKPPTVVLEPVPLAVEDVEWFESPMPSLRRFEVRLDPEAPVASRRFAIAAELLSLMGVAVALCWFFGAVVAHLLL